MENVRKHRDSKVETNETRKNYLVSKPKYYAYMFFFRKAISNRNGKNTNAHE